MTGLWALLTPRSDPCRRPKGSWWLFLPRGHKPGSAGLVSAAPALRVCCAGASQEPPPAGTWARPSWVSGAGEQSAISCLGSCCFWRGAGAPLSQMGPGAPPSRQAPATWPQWAAAGAQQWRARPPSLGVLIGVQWRQVGAGNATPLSPAQRAVSAPEGLPPGVGAAQPLSQPGLSWGLQPSV